MNVLQLFKSITTFIFDMDGVLTDGTVLVLQNGVQARNMNIKDGLGLQMALKNGFRVIVVSGGNSEEAKERLIKLGVTEVYMSVKNKKGFVEELLVYKGAQWNELLYMADDLPDIALMKSVGVSCSPADAVPEVLEVSSYISHLCGGKGCVRDVIEKVLRVQDKWNYSDDVMSK